MYRGWVDAGSAVSVVAGWSSGITFQGGKNASAHDDFNFVSRRACSGSECENRNVIRSYRDEAVVLRTQKLGEADRIIWLLTSEHGQIRAVAKGVRRTTSKFGARLEPFSVVDVQLHRGRSLDTIIQVETIASHGELLAADYELYSRASVIVETADKLSSDGDDGTHQQYLLLSLIHI